MRAKEAVSAAASERRTNFSGHAQLRLRASIAHSGHRVGKILHPDGKLVYAGLASTGMPDAELERLWHRLQPLAVPKMPLSEPPPRGSRFGSPLVLSRVHWVRPEMVVEVSYAEWTPEGLLRHVVYLGEREDKPAIEVRRSPPDQGP